MTRFLACAAAALLGAQIAATPAAAFAPASRGAVSAPETVTSAQFRFPWEQRAKPKRRTKQRPRAEKRRPAPPAAIPAGKRERQPAGPADPMDAALPALVAPLGLALRGSTRREAEQWTALAAQVPPPPSPPPLPEDGPAPAPAYVAALLAAPGGDMSGLVDGPDDQEDEGPDLHVPLPPTRPPGPGEQVAVTPPGALPPGATGVPLPPDRSGGEAEAPELPAGPTAPALPLPVTAHADDPDCAPLADPEFALSKELEPIEGPGVCGGGPLVELTGVKRKDGGVIKIKPAATLRCGMAKALADYLRDDLAPAAKLSGQELERLEIAGSFQCRGRNGASGGKMSEHGRANAVDLSGFGLSDGSSFGIFASDLPQALADKAKSGACGRFSTVLGPGSDGFHETHLHLDLQPRRSKAKLCQWSDPEVAKAKPEDRQETERTAKSVNASAPSPTAEKRDDPPLPTPKPAP